MKYAAQWKVGRLWSKIAPHGDISSMQRKHKHATSGVDNYFKSNGIT